MSAAPPAPPGLVEARCRWIILQELYDLRQQFGDAVIDGNFEAIYAAVLASVGRKYEDGNSVALLKLRIHTAIGDIITQLKEQLGTGG